MPNLILEKSQGHIHEILYIHRLAYMCFVLELSLNTAKRPSHTQPALLRYRENLSFQDPFYKFSLNLSYLTSYMCFVKELSLHVNTAN